MKKSILLHGTPDSLRKFLSDAVSRDFEIVAVLSDEPEKIPVNVEVFRPQAVPKFVLELVDGIIFTGDKSDVNFFLKQGIAPRKIILWDFQRGWEFFGGRDENGAQVMFFYGLEFHIRNDDDAKFLNSIVWQLQINRQIKNTPPQQYPAVLEQTFRQLVRRPLDFKNLRTISEKLQWLKIFDATELKSRLADKYAVRSRVAEKIGAEYLIPLLGVWNNFEDIDFDDLPNQFVLKCNHGSGMNIICRDKKTFDVERAREKINAWLAVDFGALPALELHYSRIDGKIIAEQFLSDGKSSDVNDYKFWCFNGQVKYVQVDRDRSTNHVQRFYTPDWKPLPFIIVRHTLDDKLQRKPATLKKMLKLAETLSAGFNLVRVDLYCVGGKIYFGEMTFTPLAGFMNWRPDGIDYEFGSLLRLNVDK